jgi:hypothetical protein
MTKLDWDKAKQHQPTMTSGLDARLDRMARKARKRSAMNSFAAKVQRMADQETHEPWKVRLLDAVARLRRGSPVTVAQANLIGVIDKKIKDRRERIKRKQRLARE